MEDVVEDVDCLGSSSVDEIVALASNVIAIVMVISIGIISIRKLATDDKYEMHLVLEILYFTTIITACISLSGSIVSIILCQSYSVSRWFQIFVIIVVVGAGYLIICSALLSSLVLRLYFTFRGSRWSISKKKVALSLSFLLLSDMILFAAGAVWYMGWMALQGIYLAQFVAMIIYVADSIWAVRHFSANLLHLAKMRAAAKLRLQEQPQLSDRPQKMINISSKYVSLFILALSTTLFTFVVTAPFWFGPSWSIHPGIFWSIDCVVNTVCLYLYHNFAADHYDRFCSGLDRCCRWRMIKNVKMDFMTRKRNMPKKNVVKDKSDDVPDSVGEDTIRVDSPVQTTSNTPQSINSSDGMGRERDEPGNTEIILDNYNSQSTGS